MVIFVDISALLFLSVVSRSTLTGDEPDELARGAIAARCSQFHVGNVA
jgi:hypothetical protein